MGSDTQLASGEDFHKEMSGDVFGMSGVICSGEMFRGLIFHGGDVRRIVRGACAGPHID